MLSNVSVVQMIPAEGWLAVYDSGSGDVQQLHTRALACWALVEDLAPDRAEGHPDPASPEYRTPAEEAGGAGGRRIIGVDADKIAGIHPPGRFVGYAKVGESLERFRQGR